MIPEYNLDLKVSTKLNMPNFAFSLFTVPKTISISLISFFESSEISSSISIINSKIKIKRSIYKNFLE